MQFRALAAHPLPAGEAALLDAWQGGAGAGAGAGAGGAHAMRLPLLEEEIEAVAAVLAASSGLLPPSLRRGEHGFAAGWLPLLELGGDARARAAGAL